MDLICSGINLLPFRDVYLCKIHIWVRFDNGFRVGTTHARQASQHNITCIFSDCSKTISQLLTFYVSFIDTKL